MISNSFTQSYPLQKEFKDILYLFQSSLDTQHQSEFLKQKSTIQQIIDNNSSKEHQKRILSEFCGYGPLDRLINDNNINEIIINNKDDILFEQNGVLNILEDSFLSDITFNNIVEKLATESKLVINLKKPFAEGKWRDFRIHITRPPLVKKDFHISLRKHPPSQWNFRKLFNHNWAPEKAITLLKEIIKERHNFLIVGPTSSGKTSVLNACLQELESNERVITIEDADEIVLPNLASTKLLTQNSSEDSLTLVDQEDLLKQSLRLRPDRLVMGEVRGQESKSLLLALASGHQGSIGTIHGNSYNQSLWKLEMLTQMGAPQWHSSTIQKLIFSSLQVLVVLEKTKHLRRLKGIYKISSHEPTGFLFDKLFENTD